MTRTRRTEVTREKLIETMAEAVQQTACARVGVTPVSPVPYLFVEDVQAAIAALDQAGFAIVPKEPSEGMVDAARFAQRKSHDLHGS